MKHARLSLAALLLAVAPLGAQGNDPDVARSQGGADTPAGWQVRLDRPNADRSTLLFANAGTGMHVTSGPAGIFWNPGSVGSGTYTAQVTMRQERAPAHAEAYGLIWGAKNLTGDNIDYLYFVIRKDGKYLVRHRAGAVTHDVTPWTEHAAIVKEGPDGKATNTLRIEVTATSTRLLANGQLLQEIPRQGMTAGTDGIVGLRVNHNLDIHIEGFRVQR